MPLSLALTDLVAPYLLKARNLNAGHAFLSVLRVVEYHAGADASGTVIRGRAEFQGRLRVPGPGGSLFTFRNDETDPPFDPSNRDPVFDLSETSIGFELHVPKAASPVIAAGAAALAANAGFAPIQALLTDWDAIPGDAPPSDFPASAFTLDLIVNAPTWRPGGLTPAELTPDGLLVPDRSGATEVVLTLPKLRLRLTHDRNGDGVLRCVLASFSAASLDDPADTEIVNAVTMTPPYALFDDGIGIGFRGASLDLSNEASPPEVLKRIGVGDDWRGLYLPEIRLFVPTDGFAVDLCARDFLWGFQPTPGISGDFEAALIRVGANVPLTLGVRFFDERGRSYGTVEREGATRNAVVPAVTRMVVDVEGGRTPYTVTVKVGDAAPAQGRVFAIDLTDDASATIVVNVEDAGQGGMRNTGDLTVNVRKGDPRIVLVTPGKPAEPKKPATLQIDANADPKLKIDSQDDRWVTVVAEPTDREIRWSVDGGTETAPQATFAVEVKPGETRQVKASIPAQTLQGLPVFYYFDHPSAPGSGNAADQLRDSVKPDDLAWTTVARGRLPSSGREPGGHAAFRSKADRELLAAAQEAGAALTITGDASYEGDESKLQHNYPLARRRALAAWGLLDEEMKLKGLGRFPAPTILPAFDNYQSDPGIGAWKANWMGRADAGGRQWWRADVRFDLPQNRGPRSSTATLNRPTAAPGTDPQIKVLDPPAPNPPDTPPWFRSARVKVRYVEGRLIAVQVDGEVDVQTLAEAKMRKTGQVEGQPPGDLRTLANGRPLGPDNPGDGITAFRFLYQKDDATGQKVVSLSLGADPSDTDGLVAVGWLPGENRAARSFWRNLLGSYVSFWPLLVNAAERDLGAPVDATIAVAEMVIPPAVAALPWFTVERVILHGGQYLGRWRPAGSEGNLFLDLEAAWSVSLPRSASPLIWIDPQAPLSVRYKAIGVRLANFDDDGKPISPRYDFRPVFDSSRGYSIGVDKSGAIQVRAPFDRILRILAARLSRTNPLTFEVDIGMGVDFGVVTFDRLGVRARLSNPEKVEITAMGASVDIPGALAGRGYLEIKETAIKGELDLTVRPIGLRVSGAIAIEDIPAERGGPATALYVGMDLLLPFGIPLANSGLGIFGFRGLFGMHYARTEVKPNASVPALEWLKAAKGRPNKLVSEAGQTLWEAKIDRWSFGVGVIIGTMEGGVLFNLDGTLMLELPGPHIIVAANARFLQPPPAMDKAGGVGGILGVIEIAPDFLAVGIYATYEIKRLIEIKVPAEAWFSRSNLANWHFYLGARPDIANGPGPITIRVLGIVDGTGYLMVRGEGLPKFDPLPAISGFAVGVGAGASFVWGNVDIGLYAKLGGSIDAVAGFDPLLVAGTLKVYGELRLFVASVGADASLTVVVREQRLKAERPSLPYVPDLRVKVEGKVCGHIDLWFFEISDCVSLSFGDDGDEPAVPRLVDRVSLRSRSPALAQGTGVDRPIDASLGDAGEGKEPPASVPVVPVDAIPVATLLAAPAIDGATFFGTAIAPPPNVGTQPVDRGGEKYTYALKAVRLERIADNGAVINDTVHPGPTPAQWWTRQGATGGPTNAHLALLTWDLDPAPKAIETSDQRATTIRDRWGTLCDPAAEPASVLWTFRFEPLGPSATGWMLEGIAWPDPPGSRRSSPADTTLDVRETWRTGIASVDTARGVMPAIVIGGAIPCRRVTRGVEALSGTVRIGGRGPVTNVLADGGRAGFALSAADPVLRRLVTSDTVKPFRVSDALLAKARAATGDAAAPPRDRATVLSALARGEAVTRADVLAALSPVPTEPARDRRGCEARVLQGPLLDDGTLVRYGDPGKADAVRKALETADVRHEPLDNVVRLETGGFRLCRLLMFVTPLETGTVVVRVLAANGTELARQAVSFADRTPPKPLPPSWTDASGPWAGDVADVMTFMAAQQKLGRYFAALVELPDHKDAARVEIGLQRRGDANQGLLVPCFLGAVEVLRMSEFVRHDFDDTTIKVEQKFVTDALSAGSATHALLHPSALYRLSLEWSGKRASSGTTGGDTQHFWFRTDDKPPARLDPFLLMTSPGERESHVFRARAIDLVFNTTGIAQLWGVYGTTLKVRIQAASGKHPPGQTPGALSQFTLDKEVFAPAGNHVLSPFEEALVQVVSALPCIPVDGSRERQSIVTIKVPLHAYTDYLFDVVAVGANEAVTADTDFVFRRRFSTGAFETLADLAASVGAVAVAHKALPAGSAATHLAVFASRSPQGEELDAALRACGVDVDGAPRDPRTVVFWESVAGVIQPVAVLIDAQEPLWRRRAYPEQVADPDGLPGTKRWTLVDKAWLELVPAAGTEALIVGKPAEAPGGQRALVLLAPGARGKRVQLDLRQCPFPEPYLNVPEERRMVFDAILARAPWEE